MSWHAHKTKSQRKIITLQEWADYIGVSRNTIHTRLTKYRLLGYPLKAGQYGVGHAAIPGG